ncbi:hypothetical protein, variant [Exophiala mesophila]|uniref:Uncharacterized protein n=1 Tax=Exophiala mesophila TaxID=212818 RepID=A0A0D1ZCX2_EXOME|nr:uncharacterized protein PV10_06302 [Exophiala mesophila]XP_016223374.1 hypothetical protein, variant [Exophiala mesophila]KIV91799.1 hypothetical protein PV10_06302 [Exophiala mesophila]KIV91800.1 hypothetical protein, variant [Exophiala mesophila]
MSLKTIYQRFLENPNPISLSDNASLHYVTTLKSYDEPAGIIRHLETQDKKIVKTKSAKVISAVEGHDALAIEVETVLEFISGGGAYLPGLENFVVDKIATIPTTHFVQFTADQKISGIRIFWDQGSLLKQTDVIGSRGRNWPLVDGQDQIRLIKSNVRAAPVNNTESSGPNRGRAESGNISSSRTTSPSKKHIRDPHASLDLFAPKPIDENSNQSGSNVVAPRASAKPPAREMNELFAAGHEDHEPGSPKKVPIVPVLPPKGRSNQKFAPSRLFADDPDEPKAVGYKSNPAKYNHFDIGDENEDDPMQHHEPVGQASENVPLRPKTTKHAPQWEFQDFYTPAKVGQRVRGQDVVHFSLTNPASNPETPGQKAAARPRRDNETHFELKDDGTPIERHVVPKPRKDADPHFEFKDTDTPAPARMSGRPTSSAGDRQGLYTNNLYDEEDSARGESKAPLATITNNQGRKNDFERHWGTSDESPSMERTGNENNHAAHGHKKAVQMMDSHWEVDDQPTEQDLKQAKQGPVKKGLESHWSMGDVTTDTNGKTAKKGGFWDF